MTWRIKTLDELCEIARGGSPRPIQKFLTDDPTGINWIRISDATASSRYIYKTKQKIRPEGIKRSRLVKEGDFLLSNSMSFGRPYIMRTSGCIHDGWLVLSDKSGLYNNEYLYYFLGSPNAYRQFDARAAGSTVRNLNIDLVRTVEVPLPSLAEQARIVDILDVAFDGIDTAIANAEQNLANARALFDSHLRTVFDAEGKGWPKVPVGEIAEHCLGKMLDKAKNKGVPKPYLRNINVRWFAVTTEDLMEMRIEEREEDQYTVRYGDLLICEGGYPGRAAIWEQNDTVFFQKALHRVRFHDPVYNKWMLYFLYFLDRGDRLRGHFTGAGIQHLTGAALARLPVPLATSDAAERYVETFDALFAETRRLEEVYLEKIGFLQVLKRSLLHKAFTGGLNASPDTILNEAATAQAAE